MRTAVATRASVCKTEGRGTVESGFPFCRHSLEASCQQLPLPAAASPQAGMNFRTALGGLHNRLSPSACLERLSGCSVFASFCDSTGAGQYGLLEIVGESADAEVEHRQGDGDRARHPQLYRPAVCVARLSRWFVHLMPQLSELELACVQGTPICRGITPPGSPRTGVPRQCSAEMGALSVCNKK